MDVVKERVGCGKVGRIDKFMEGLKGHAEEFVNLYFFHKYSKNLYFMIILGLVWCLRQ